MAAHSRRLRSKWSYQYWLLIIPRPARLFEDDALELGDARPFAPRGPTTREGVGLKSGALLVREWSGRLERVMVLDDGYAWNGCVYRSLSQVAKAITGRNWNGHRFFGLKAVRNGAPNRKRASNRHPAGEAEKTAARYSANRPELRGFLSTGKPRRFAGTAWWGMQSCGTGLGQARVQARRAGERLREDTPVCSYTFFRSGSRSRLVQRHNVKS